MIRIVLADDRPLIREGLRRLLGTEPSLSVVGAAKDAPELFSVLERESCDVVVLDVHMPGPGFLETLSRIRSASHPPGVLVLSSSPEDLFALRALRHGASGYLTKDAEPDEIVLAIQQIARGEKYITPILADLLVQGITDGAERLPHHDLSGREFDVLRLLGAGNSTEDVAKTLSISPKTVATYRSRIYQKLDLKGMPQLIRYALEYGIAE